MGSSFSVRKLGGLQVLLNPLSVSLSFFVFQATAQPQIKILESFDQLPRPEDSAQPTPQSLMPHQLAAPSWSLGRSKRPPFEYFLMSEGSQVFLRGTSPPGADARVIHKEIAWSVQEYPWFRWRWRVQRFAEGATMSDSKKEDAAAAVYVTIKSGVRAYVIKYMWATTDPIGSSYEKGRWNPTGSLRALVIRSGGALNEWHTENRNLSQDFETLFKKKMPTTNAAGIGVLVDGDLTKSEPSADFDDFTASASGTFP